MSISGSDPAGPAAILPVGDRQLERIQPDQSLVVRVQPVGGRRPAAAVEARVRDLSLHGLLLESIPSLGQGDVVDLIDLEAQPIRASVVRQSDLGTHVSFVDHLHPRYTRARAAGSNRRRYSRVPCEAPATIGAAVATVLNASLGGVLLRVATPGRWAVGDRLRLTIDSRDGPVSGEVVSVSEDRLSIRFARAQSRLRITAADCMITVEQRRTKAKRSTAAAKAKRAAASKRATAPKAKRAVRKTRATPKPKAKPKPKRT